MCMVFVSRALCRGSCAGARPGEALHAAIYNDTQTYVIKRPSPGRHAPRAQPRPRTESRDRGSQNRTSNPHRGHAQNPAPCDRESQDRHALCRGGAHACIGLGVRTSTILSLALCLYIHIYIYIYACNYYILHS